MNIRNLIGLGAISAVLLTSAGRAQTSPFYAGVNVSWSLLDPSPKLLAAKGLQSADFNKDDAVGYKVYGGYQLNPTWGAELAYSDIGSAPVRGFITVLNPTTALLEPTAVTGAADFTTISAVATLTVPFAEGVTFVFKAGAHFWSIDEHVGTRNALLTGTPPALPSGFRLPASATASATGADIVFGVTTLFDFTPRWATRLDIEKYLGNNDSMTFSGGVQFKF